MSIKKLKMVLAGIPLLVTAVIGLTVLPAATAAPTNNSASTPPKVRSGISAPAKGLQALKGKPNLADQRLNSSSSVSGQSGSTTTLSAPVPQYFYGGGYQYVVSDGAYVNLNVFNTYLNSNDAHTLAELAVQSADGTQAVEIGWTKDAAVCGAYTPGSSGPCLFTYSWVNGVGMGYNAGFVDYAPTTLNVGATLPLTASGTNTRFGIQSFNNNWWVSVNLGDGTGQKWIGYFPQSIWSGASPSVTFNEAGLIQTFGEVAAKATGDNTPCTDMGNGVLGLNSNTSSARIGSFSLINPQSGAIPNLSIDGSSQNYPGKYYTDVAGNPIPGNVRTLRYGGPGWNAAGTGNGTIGGC